MEINKMEYKKEIESITDKFLTMVREDLEDSLKVNQIDEDEYYKELSKWELFGDKERAELAKTLNDSIQLALIETWEKD